MPTRIDHTQSRILGACLWTVPYTARNRSITLVASPHRKPVTTHLMDSDWAFPAALQPQNDQIQFDLNTAFRSVVRIHSEVPANAFTARILGTDRSGNGVVIHAGGRQLVLTAGYVVTEANNIWLTTHDERVIPGHTLGFDQVTGFGVILPLGQLDTPALRIGSAAHLQPGSAVTVIGHGGAAHSLQAQIIGRHEFAGYWEYLLDDALLVAPPHPEFAGCALLDASGQLAGLGSLLMQEHVSGDQFDANLFIPIDLLPPVLDALLTTGQARTTKRPWLGVYVTDQEDEILIMAVAEGGPARQARLRQGDVIIEIARQPVASLADFYRHLWQQGVAGCSVELTVKRSTRTRRIMVKSACRDDFLLKARAH
jgi:S1-C subfamily serine protease